MFSCHPSARGRLAELPRSGSSVPERINPVVVLLTLSYASLARTRLRLAVTSLMNQRSDCQFDVITTSEPCSTSATGSGSSHERLHGWTTMADSLLTSAW